jgi:sigma-B regulation protein RsbU (phosphoserine phosphatase)
MDHTVVVLLIEDSQTDARLVGIHLAQADVRFGRFQVERVPTLATAFERLATNRIDVILLDLNLPDCEGLETFRRIHAQAPQIPVVVLTGYEDVDQAVEAIRLGADDFFPKADLDSASLARTIRFAVERRQWRALREEMRWASHIQQKLLPKHVPQLSCFDIFGACRPAESVAGDYFDYIPLPDGRMGVVIGDVVGHGLGPALIMAGTRRLLRALVEIHHDLGDILTLANRVLEQDMDPGMFITLFFGCLDPGDGSLTYAAGGHPAYLIDASGRSRRLAATGIPLGMLANAVIPCGDPVLLRPGAVLLMVTDGFEEALSASDERFGIARVLDVVRARRAASAKEIVDALYAELDAFCTPATPADDTTAVVVKMTGYM